MRLNEASWLVHLVSRDPKSSPLKSCLRGSNFCKISGFGFLQFSGSREHQGLAFLNIQPPKNFDLGLNRCNIGRHKFLCKQIFQIPIFAETLISSRGRGERVSPCEIFPIQASFDAMLRFHMLIYISLVFNPNSQQQHMKNH